MSTAAEGQARVIERHRVSAPEGRLLAFYSSAMAFSPAGLDVGGAGLSIGVEVSYVPFLNEAQRRRSIDKPESTNLAPVFPRPRLGLRLPRGLRAELSWVPPLKVFDVRAHLGAASIARPARMAGLDVTPRLWAVTGRVRGAMTCNTGTMIGHGSALETYFASVCHGNESDDWFEPRLLGGEILAGPALGGGAFRIYAGAGARYDRTRFDIGVRMADGSRDPDHPILELDAVRPHGTLGASWAARRRWTAGGEVFYAPGSLVTARVTARYTVRP